MMNQASTLAAWSSHGSLPPCPAAGCAGFQISPLHSRRCRPGCSKMADRAAPVRLRELLGVAVVQGLQQVGAHARACPACDAVAQHEALQAVAVAHLPVCTASHVQKADMQDAGLSFCGIGVKTVMCGICLMHPVQDLRHAEWKDAVCLEAD